MSENDSPDPLETVPNNWGKWGDDDEVGAVNYLTEEEVLRGISTVEKGETFTLGLPIGGKEEAMSHPGRSEFQHHMNLDHGHFLAGKADMGEGMGASDDSVNIALHGATHVDALGHSWYDNELYNGFDPKTTMGGLERCSISPIAEHSVLGRGVLLDIPRYKGVDHLEKGEGISLDDLLSCAEEQSVEIENRDFILIRTGWLEVFYNDSETFFEGGFREPGLTFSQELVEWFHKKEIPGFGTDTLTNEQRHSQSVDIPTPIHSALLRDQGVLFNESLMLDELANDCASDKTYDFLFIISPLKFEGGTASPVNPVAVK